MIELSNSAICLMAIACVAVYCVQIRRLWNVAAPHVLRRYWHRWPGSVATVVLAIVATGAWLAGACTVWEFAVTLATAAILIIGVGEWMYQRRTAP